MNNTEKIEKHIAMMKLLQEGGMLDCPLCNNGKVRAVNEAAFLCDNCGKGIVRRVPLEK